MRGAQSDRLFGIGWSHLLSLGLIAGLFAGEAVAQSAWKLIYLRQIGNYVNGGAFTIENHAALEDGSKAAGFGLTNQFNLNTNVWGQFDINGYNRILPNAFGARDVRIFDGSTPTDQTPNLYHADPNGTARYSFETHWMKFTEPSRVTAHPAFPVYHYDKVSGLANSQYVPPQGYLSDDFTQVTWTEPFFQTFVVPAGINRLITAKAWMLHAQPTRYILSIHEDNGGAVNTWSQVGAALTSREFHPTEFTPVTVNWGLQGMPVTPGGRYAIKVRPSLCCGTEFYATKADNYPHGHLSMMVNNQLVEIPGRDMLAVITGVGYDLVVDPATILLSTSTLTPSVFAGDNHPNQSFTVRNTGVAELNYQVSESVPWLNVSPISGSSTGEADTITVTYNTAGLSVGQHNATISVTAFGASNTPQAVNVTLTVNASPFAPVDFDRDGDVDQGDFGTWQRCLTGPGVLVVNPTCNPADLDGDDDVDQNDFGLFQACVSGANQPADPGCAN